MKLDYMHSVNLELELPLDVGIAEAVHARRTDGVKTIESCEGVPGRPLDEPIVRILGGRSSGR